MKDNKEYYTRISPEEVQLYFKKDMITAIHIDLKKQILAKERAHLKAGQGIFIYEEHESDRGKFNVAVYVRWKVEEDSFTHFEIVTYHLFSGDMPDELLDEINILSEKGDAEWRTYDNTDTNNTETTKAD